jgi:hypothetical protein
MNKCSVCGFPVRDGKQQCPVCSGTSPHPDAFLPDGTPLYFKTSNFPSGTNLQMQLYELLANGNKN